MNESTLTKCGRISVPAAIRKALRLQSGQRLRFEVVSAHEFRVFASPQNAAGPVAALGYAKNLGRAPRLTKDWMDELREGDS
jgi:AbrB family looped-hinge helix DNA binding protein